MKNNVNGNSTQRTIGTMGLRVALLLLVAIACGIRVDSQNGIPFSSGSTGADGALNINAGGITYLTPNATNIYNFTTITIAGGSTLKISELKVHGPVYFLASGDVNINGSIDISGADSPGPTLSAAEQIPAMAGSGGYSGGLGGIHGDTNHQAFAGNGPGGGAAGDSASATVYANGGSFSTNRFLVPLVGGSGGGGTADTSAFGFGAPGGAGGGALLIASSTQISFGNNGETISANGGSGGARGCGGSGGAVRLIANTINSPQAFPNFGITVAAGGGSFCKVAPTNGLIRLETNNLNFITAGHTTAGAILTSFPFALNLPTAPPSALTIASINGVTVNANPASFPDSTINTPTSVPVVINATNIPVGATVNLYLLSDGSANQVIPVTLAGTTASSTATVQVLFPANGTRGYVKATWGTLGTMAMQPQSLRKPQ